MLDLHALGCEFNSDVEDVYMAPVSHLELNQRIRFAVGTNSDLLLLTLRSADQPEGQLARAGWPRPDHPKADILAQSRVLMLQSR